MTTSRTLLFSVLPASGFPCASKANPKRQENQSNVEQPGTPRDVETIVAELLPARDVARRVDLRDAGQPGTHGDAHREAGHVLEPHELPAVGLDLAGPERTRAHEAHVATEDVPELWQLIHGSRPHEASHARHARIARARDDRAGHGFGIGAHRSKLERRERPAPEPDALLAEHHRTSVFELD